MNHHYRDITEKLGPPLWWDEAAVPRYCEVSPEASANIYAQEFVILGIACQSCGRCFTVAISSGSLDVTTLATQVEEDAIHYGDPPNSGCCGAGPTMNSIPRRVLQFWRRERDPFEWKRVPRLERALECEWAS